MEKSSSSGRGYMPPHGSKVAMAIKALQDGPIKCATMARVMACEPEAVDAHLRTPLSHGAIIKVRDETGLVHFAVPGSMNAGFEILQDQAPAQDAIGSARPVIDPHDPFGLVAQLAAGDQRDHFRRADKPATEDIAPPDSAALVSKSGKQRRGDSVICYTPRAGSAAAAAIAALRDGPMSTKVLGKAIDLPRENLNGALSAAMKNKLIIKVQDQAGQLHYALLGAELGPRFTEYAGGRQVAAPAKAAPAPASAIVVTRPAPGPAVPSSPLADDTDAFLAYISHVGDLTISTGSARVVVGQKNQKALYDFLTRMGL